MNCRHGKGSTIPIVRTDTLISGGLVLMRGVSWWVTLVGDLGLLGVDGKHLVLIGLIKESYVCLKLLRKVNRLNSRQWSRHPGTPPRGS